MYEYLRNTARNYIKPGKEFFLHLIRQTNLTDPNPITTFIPMEWIHALQIYKYEGN